MAHRKTAISIDESLFLDVDFVAKEKHISRSRLIEIAVKEWIKKQKKKLLIKAINTVVAKDTFDGEDKQQMDFMQKHQRDLIEDGW